MRFVDTAKISKKEVPKVLRVPKMPKVEEKK